MSRRRSARSTGAGGIGGETTRVVHQVAAWCLGYPDPDLLARLPVLHHALTEQPASPAVQALLGFVDHLAGSAPERLVRDYVEVFDMSSKQALYLSYWTDGDTRRRGETLAAFKQRYRAAGMLVDTHGELPDYLPMVLEYAALADPRDGRELLQDYRASLELIRIALVERSSPYAAVLSAVCATLPGASPQDRASAMALARTGPPSETVGLEPLPYPTLRPAEVR
ncbi:nitrate reductase molybdenum cofactor assembly chaperone [Nocardioides sambongensis]|uniref:nitrate reductase molybdenum cofactor assembly chaperone n=1 Tax=Nocardioides sambongensis TaxID=2589074 RepID=UPI001E42A567|nr:nitrate reductase molybdenum cofactor assembly chaperone [Nocardioides sambongensis]